MTNLNEEVKTEEKVKAKPGPKPKSQEDGVDVTEELKNGKILYGANRLIGYVSQARKLFKVGFKNKVIHVSWKGHLVLPKCPKCGHRNSASEAVKGVCEKCGYDAEESL